MSPSLDTLYWVALTAAALSASIVVLMIAEGRLAGRAAVAAMLLAIVALVLAGRWPAVFMTGPLNPDESMMLAQAMKFGSDPMPWRAMDPGTGGPVNSYVLLAGHWLGIPYGYPLARIMAMACLASALGLGFLGLQRIGGPRAAAVALLPVAMFVATAADDDFLHYSSELASLAAIGLLGFVLAGFSNVATPWRADLRRGLLGGACAFLVAMSKVQGVPLGAAVAFGALALTAPDMATFLRRGCSVAAGALLPLAALLLLLALTGVLGDFRISFVELPAAYAATPLSATDTKHFVLDTGESRAIVQTTVWLAAIALGAQAFAGLLPVSRRGMLRAACLAVFIAASYVTLSQPGRAFPHYLNYLVVGAMWTLFLILPWDGITGRSRPGEGR